MVINNLGYIFECRLDCRKTYGFMQQFKVNYRDNVQITNITTAVGSDGKLTIPAYNNLSLGFKPISDICDDIDSLNTYIKSNKSAFGVLGSFALIVNATLKYDMGTGELLDDSIIEFFVPKTVTILQNSLDGFKENTPIMICEKVTSDGGINISRISKLVYDAYVSSFKSCISMDSVSSRKSFMASILGFEG